MKNILLFTSLLVALIFAFTSCGSNEFDFNDPIAAITVSSNDSLKVQFFNASVNSNSYLWDFGDGSTSTEKDPFHQFPEEGTYEVTLSVSGQANNTDYTDQTKIFVEATIPVLRNFIMFKDWRLIRENSVAIEIGRISEVWDYDIEVPAPSVFNVGDLVYEDTVYSIAVLTQLKDRLALANDVYTFSYDSSYTVNYNGDFWGELGFWADTPSASTNIPIDGGTLPLLANETDVSAFITEKQTFWVDEQAETITVSGLGAHIINPRYQNNQTSLVVPDQIVYNIHKWVEGPEADTLVLTNEITDKEFDEDYIYYYTLAYYKNDVPEIRM